MAKQEPAETITTEKVLDEASKHETKTPAEQAVITQEEDLKSGKENAT